VVSAAGRNERSASVARRLLSGSESKGESKVISSSGATCTEGEKAAWANALWELQERTEGLQCRLAAAQSRGRTLRARMAELDAASLSSLEEMRTFHAAQLVIVDEKAAQRRSELEAQSAEVCNYRGKAERMASGLQAKEEQILRGGQQLADLQARREALIREGEERVARTRALGLARARLELKLLRDGTEVLSGNVSRARLIHNEYLSLKGNIRVFCRFRPMLEGEALLSPPLKVDLRDDSQLTVHSGLTKSVTGMSEHSSAWDFTFDRIFGQDADQTSVFEEISLLVQSALDGYRVAIFAYGQTGSGKTYTMEGPQQELSEAADMGMTPRAVDLIFAEVKELRQKGWAFELHASMLEVYNDAVRDLLPTRPGTAQSSTRGETPRAMELGETGEDWVARRVRVENASTVHALLRRAARERHVAATACNDRSSRSHAIFQLHISGSRLVDGNCEEVSGQLSLVDLAGSERVEKSGVSGERMREAQCINRSLSALGDVVEALARRGQQNESRSAGGAGAGACTHIPYRNSRLTMLLKSSLGGDAKALMFVNASPSAQHLQETLSSLRFASKVHACTVGVARRNASAPTKGARSASRPI